MKYILFFLMTIVVSASDPTPYHYVAAPNGYYPAAYIPMAGQHGGTTVINNFYGQVSHGVKGVYHSAENVASKVGGKFLPSTQGVNTKARMGNLIMGATLYDGYRAHKKGKDMGEWGKKRGAIGLGAYMLRKPLGKLPIIKNVISVIK